MEKILENEEELQRRCRKEWYSYLWEEGGVLRLNHGSFGAAPEPVLRRSEALRSLWLKNPDHMYYHLLPALMLQNTLSLVQLINARTPSQIALIDNTTTGIAIVANSIAWRLVDLKSSSSSSSLSSSLSSTSSSSSSSLSSSLTTIGKDEQPVVILFSTTYAAVKNAFMATTERAGAHLEYVRVPFPLASSSEVMAELKRTFERIEQRVPRSRVVLTVIDHITSVPAMVMPVKEMAALCRQRAPHGQILIDGAHAIGQVPIDVQDLDVDFYCSNIHKWGLATTGAAFLYTRSPEQEKLIHPIISHNYLQGISRESMWTGTKDMSSLLSVDEVFRFLSMIGGVDKLIHRNRTLLLQARRMLAEAWHTERATPDEMCASLGMVGLPYPQLQFEDVEIATYRLRSLLRDKYGMEVVVMAVPPRGYIRLSCAIYNTLEDFHKLRDAILDIIQTKSFSGHAHHDASTCSISDPWLARPGPIIQAKL